MLVTNNRLKQKNNRQKFGNLANAATQTLRFLNTSPAIGASCVDLGAMSAPRTIIDISRRPEAGLETGIREGGGTANHALIGAYGMLATTLLSGGLNKKFNINSNKVFANFDNINSMGEIWGDIVKTMPEKSPIEMRKKFFANILDNVVNNSQDKTGKIVTKKLDEKTKNLFMQEISEFLEKKPNVYTVPSKVHNNLKSIILNATSSESDYILKTAKYATNTDLDSLLKTSFSLSKLFSEKKPMQEFKKAIESGTNFFIDSLKKTKLKSSLLGVAIAMGIGATVQPFNVWLTKKRTGKDGFVGLENQKKDTSLKFKAIKTGTAAGFLAFAYYSIVNKAIKLPVKKQVNVLLNKLQFNGLIPSIPQFKAIYAFTIASRFMAARDKNELRESATKDFLGFANWLILGDFVQKLIATGRKQGLTTYDETKHGKGLWNKIFNLDVKVKSHDEILFEELKKANFASDMMKSVDGKMLSPQELIKKFGDKLPNLQKRIRGKNIAQVTGYLYSALVLGILIPKLNIAITNHLQKQKHQDKQTV